MSIGGRGRGETSCTQQELRKDSSLLLSSNPVERGMKGWIGSGLERDGVFSASELFSQREREREGREKSTRQIHLFPLWLKRWREGMRAGGRVCPGCLSETWMNGEGDRDRDGLPVIQRRPLLVDAGALVAQLDLLNVSD